MSARGADGQRAIAGRPSYGLAWGIVRSLRPRQWTKNLLIFAGLVFTYNLTNVQALTTTIVAFAVFCALSSAGYLWNDARDVEADRAHPTKRNRPIASGAVPVSVALWIAVALLIAATAGALSIGPSFAAVAAGYLALTFAYTVWFKHMVLIDVFAISTGFVLRAVAGAVAIGVPVSPWLYVCTVLVSLFIALGKRRNELELLDVGAVEHRRILRDYTVELVDQLILIVASATVMAYSLYTFSAENLPRNHAMMLTIPVVLYGLFRYLYLVRVRGQGGAPEDMLLSDPGLLGSAVVWVGLSLAILYLAR
jgi:4-hydroxybenzoate polyprenyltransferase